MRTFTIKIGGKTYTTSRISTYAVRQLLALNKDAIAMADKYTTLDVTGMSDITIASEILNTVDQVYAKKSALISDIYGNKFTAEDVEKALTKEELDNQIQALTLGVLGIATKN